MADSILSTLTRFGANDPQIQSRKRLADQLMAQSSSGTPVQSIGEGIARMLTGGVAGYFGHLADEEEQSRGKAAQDTIARALTEGAGKPAGLDPKTGVVFDTARPADPSLISQILASNKDTAPLALQMQLGDIDAQRQLDRALAVQRAKNELEPPKTREVKRDGKIVTEQFNPATRQFEEIATSPQFKPEAGENGGPFHGNALDAQAMNILLTGNPASPEYLAAYNHLAQPRVTFDAQSGQMVSITPNMSAFRPPAGQGAPAAPSAAPTPPAPAPAPPSAPAAPPAAPNAPVAAAPTGGVTVTPVGSPRLSMDDSMKVASINQAVRDVDATISQLVTPDGKLKPDARDLIAAATKIGPVEGVPFTEGRGLRQSARRAIEVLLRLRTGAAAPDSEVESYLNQFFPRMGDSDQQIVSKMKALRGLFTDAMGQFAAGRPGVPQPGPSPLNAAPTPAQTAPSAPQIAEGQTATNPQTGDKIVFRNGKWEPLR